MPLKEQQLKLALQKFEAGEQERTELLKYLMDKNENYGVRTVQWLTCC